MSDKRGEHTPGPWSACNNGECQCKTVASENGPVAKVTCGEWGDDYPAIRLVGESSLDQKAEAYMDRIVYGTVSEEEALANARLIAAAPALLDVVRRIRGWDHLDGAGDGAFWKRELDAALLAAVGEGK